MLLLYFFRKDMALYIDSDRISWKQFYEKYKREKVLRLVSLYLCPVSRRDAISISNKLGRSL